MFLDLVAPWIVGTWYEAVAAYSFQLPAIGLERDVAHLAAAAAGLVFLALTAACIRHLPRSARYAALALLTPLLLVPAGMVAVSHTGGSVLAAVQGAREALMRAARPTPNARLAARTNGQPLPPPVPLPQRSTASADAPTAAPATTEVAVVAAVPPPAPLSTSQQPSAAETAGATIKRVTGYLVRKASLSRDTRVVPVFYATDRAVDTGAAGLDYSAERTGRLALGRVLVSIPEAARGRTGGNAVVSEIKAMVPADVQTAAAIEAAGARHAGNRALIYVHGFNTGFQAAAIEAARIAEALQFDGALFVYCWASAGHAVQYRSDEQSASQTELLLAEFLGLVGQQSGAGVVSIVADGLGARAVVQALTSLKADASGRPGFDDLILRAPDIERDTFGSQSRALASVVRRITLYTTATDRALNISRRYAGVVPRAGDVTETGPGVFSGVTTVDVTPPPGAGRFAAGAWPQVLFTDLKVRLAPGGAGELPITPGLEAVATARGTYWRVQAGAPAR